MTENTRSAAQNSPEALLRGCDDRHEDDRRRTRVSHVARGNPWIIGRERALVASKRREFAEDPAEEEL